MDRTDDKTGRLCLEKASKRKQTSWNKHVGWVQSFHFLKLAQMSKISLSYLTKTKQLDPIIILIGKTLRDVAIIEKFYY